MSKRAVLLIDVQNDYFPGGKWTLVGIESAADNAAKLLAAARAIGDLVVHVRHEFPSADAPFFAPGSAGARVHPKCAGATASPRCSSTTSTRSAAPRRRYGCQCCCCLLRETGGLPLPRGLRPITT